MLYYKFKNYEEFQEIFGMTSHGNGVKSRKNKILLDYIKDPKLLKQAIKTNDFSLLQISSMAELKETMMRKLHNSGARTQDCKYSLQLMDYILYSPIYSTDENKGLCEDGTSTHVRYYNHEREQIFKMKAGRLMNHIIESCPFGKTLEGKAVKNWLCEEFTLDWQAYTMSKIPKNTLHVDENFKDIYSLGCMKRDNDHDRDPFHSCMTNKNNWKFYLNSVSARAAYLTENETGLIIARCIIFTDVRDEEGNKWRMAERQYSYNQNLVYQRALIDALIQGGYIDCYKKIGAGCGDSRAIVDIHGNDLSNKYFEIDCDLEYDDPLSYQDSFKWYNTNEGKAYNYEPEHCDYELDVTEGSLEANFEGHEDDDENYDDYHEEYTYSDLVDVYCEGLRMTCSEERLEDFEWFQGHWYHKDDLQLCVCGERMLSVEYYAEHLSYSEVLGEYYCSDECRDQAERDFKARNWYYSDYDEEYFKDEEEITTFITLNTETGRFEEQTISVNTLSSLLIQKEMIQIGDMYYETKLAAS